MLQFKYFSLHQFHYSFYQILFCLHSAFHAEVSQSVCKPNQIIEFWVVPMLQKVSNCGKYWVEIESARNKMNQHRSKISVSRKTRKVTYKFWVFCIKWRKSFLLLLNSCKNTEAFHASTVSDISYIWQINLR